MRNHSEHWKHWFGNLEILQLEEIVCMPVWENVSLLSLSSNTRLPACWVLEIQNFRRAWKLENDDFSGESSQTKKCPQFVCETGDMCCSGTYETQRYDGTSFCQEFPVQSTIKFHHSIWLSYSLSNAQELGPNGLLLMTLRATILVVRIWKVVI